jgi:hypothetical protein
MSRGRSTGTCSGGAGCGTSVCKPVGANGVITMKMMMSTSSTSIMGVMLMSAFRPAPLPISIAIHCIGQ